MSQTTNSKEGGLPSMGGTELMEGYTTSAPMTSSIDQSQPEVRTAQLASSSDADAIPDLIRRFNFILIRLDRLRRTLQNPDAEVPSEVATRINEGSTLHLRELLAHMVELTREVRDPVLNAILMEANPAIDPQEPSDLLDPAYWSARTTDEILGELMRLRWQQASLISSLSSADFDRTGQHQTKGQISLATLLANFTQEDEKHLRSLQEMSAPWGEITDNTDSAIVQ